MHVFWASIGDLGPLPLRTDVSNVPPAEILGPIYQTPESVANMQYCSSGSRRDFSGRTLKENTASGNDANLGNFLAHLDDAGFLAAGPGHELHETDEVTPNNGNNSAVTNEDIKSKGGNGNVPEQTRNFKVTRSRKGYRCVSDDNRILSDPDEGLTEERCKRIAKCVAKHFQNEDGPSSLKGTKAPSFPASEKIKMQKEIDGLVGDRIILVDLCERRASAVEATAAYREQIEELLASLNQEVIDGFAARLLEHDQSTENKANNTIQALEEELQDTKSKLEETQKTSRMHCDEAYHFSGLVNCLQAEAEESGRNFHMDRTIKHKDKAYLKLAKESDHVKEAYQALQQQVAVDAELAAEKVNDLEATIERQSGTQKELASAISTIEEANASILTMINSEVTEDMLADEMNKEYERMRCHIDSLTAKTIEQEEALTKAKSEKQAMKANIVQAKKVFVNELRKYRKLEMTNNALQSENHEIHWQLELLLTEHEKLQQNHEQALREHEDEKVEMEAKARERNEQLDVAFKAEATDQFRFIIAEKEAVMAQQGQQLYNANTELRKLRVILKQREWGDNLNAACAGRWEEIHSELKDQVRHGEKQMSDMADKIRKIKYDNVEH